MKYLLLIMLLASLTSFSQSEYEVKLKPVVDVKIDERSEFLKNFTFIPITEWKEEMKFIVVPPYEDSKGDELQISEYNSKSRIPVFLKQDDWKYKVFTFKRIETPKNSYSSIVILENDNKLYQFPMMFSLDHLKNSSRTILEMEYLNKLAFLDDIDQAKAALTGKTLYLLTNSWLQKTAQGNRMVGPGTKKFIPVVITQVGLGSTSDPVRIAFTYNGKDYFIDTYLSGINSGMVKDALGKGFDQAFSFDDPRKKHLDISEQTWALIQEGAVKIGMKEAELLLSWGPPDKTNQTTLNGLKTKQFVYGDQYVYVDNSIVTSMQSSK